jgi:solute carrier family 25 (peroxisomal adenine nucleotide transporter), member 17
VTAALKKIIEKEGIPGLYSGLKSALFGIGLTNGIQSLELAKEGIYYFWYEWTKDFIEKAAIKKAGRRRPLTTVESMLAGLIAGSATVIFTNPIWVVNTRETARKDVVEHQDVDLKNLPPAEAAKEVASRATGFLRIMMNIIKTEGIGALWSGVIPALILVINPIIQYTVFEQLKTVLEKRRQSRLTPNDAFLLGALGKLLATGITYPYSSSSHCNSNCSHHQSSNATETKCRRISTI